MSKPPVAIISDSTCDIPVEHAEQLGITVIPNIIMWDNESYFDGTGQTSAFMTREAFYTRLGASKTSPTTATASVGTYEAAYQRSFDNGAESIVSIHAASQLSGIFNAASTAAQSFPGRVHVIDSGTLSLGLGFMVMAAAQAVRESSLVTDVIARAKDTVRRTRVLAIFESLEYIRRSGRVSWARAAVGQLLGVRPCIELKDGKVMRIGETRTRRKSLLRLVELIQATSPLEQIAFLHTNAEGDAREVRGMLGSSIPEPFGFINVTTVIGTHVGPNAIGFASVKAQP